MIKFINEFGKRDLIGKKILLRADFDVPLTQLPIKIGESFRIKAQKETIDYLVNAGAKALIVAHFGHEVSDASFAPIVEEIGEILGQTLTLVPYSELSSLDILFKECRLLLLDNLRQDRREIQNDDGFARELATGFDYYINNAFAAMHRVHSSVVAITRYLPSYVGLLVGREIENLNLAIDAPAEGKILVLGGAKISTKLPVIKNFLDKTEKILIGGALANNFFKARGLDVGDSLVDDLVVVDIKSEKVILPEDVLISRSADDVMEIKPYPVKDVGPDHYIPDIGPETTKRYADVIKSAKMVVWNGPMGKFEIPVFSEGTKTIAKAVAASGCSIIGGGDTITAINSLGLSLDSFSFVSTGGGAMLEFLAGNKLPGLEALGYYK